MDGEECRGEKAEDEESQSASYSPIADAAEEKSDMICRPVHGELNRVIHTTEGTEHTEL